MSSNCSESPVEKTNKKGPFSYFRFNGSDIVKVGVYLVWMAGLMFIGQDGLESAQDDFSQFPSVYEEDVTVPERKKSHLPTCECPECDKHDKAIKQNTLNSALRSKRIQIENDLQSLNQDSELTQYLTPFAEKALNLEMVGGTDKEAIDYVLYVITNLDMMDDVTKRLWMDFLPAWETEYANGVLCLQQPVLAQPVIVQDDECTGCGSGECLLGCGSDYVK
jgi:hypothetical protein